MAHLYYLDDLDAAIAPASTVTVHGDEARHAVQVSRLRVGEHTMIGNGRGTIATGVVTAATAHSFEVSVDTVEVTKRSTPRLVLVQALAKGDRDERAIEQATEFGADAVVPWQSARSVSRWRAADGTEKATKGVSKWARIAREASKQSLRSWVPEVRDLADLSDLLALAAQPHHQVLVLHPGAAESLSTVAQSFAHSALTEIAVVVGPEGGISDHELAALEAAGARVCSLGPTVLRTSSAGPAALAVINVALSRW